MIAINAVQRQGLELARNIFGGDKLWLVGGWVRDALLGRPSVDVDLTTPGSPATVLETSRHLAQTASGQIKNWRASFVPLDAENGVARIVFAPKNTASDETASFYFDIAAFQGETLESDLRRRDFSLNALAVPLDSFLANETSFRVGVIDLVGGLADLEGHVIRPIGEANIVSDPLRMLRGVRLLAQLNNFELGRGGQNWQLAPGTLDLFRQKAALIKQSAAERVREELEKTMLAGNAEASLRLLDETSLLSLIIPELDEGKGLAQMSAHYYDVFNHSLVTVDRIEWLVRSDYNGSGLDAMAMATRPEAVVKHWPQVLDGLYANHRERLGWLLWAALLHDIAKPRTRTVDENGKIHFYEHPNMGAEMSRAIMSRLRFPRDATEAVATMILHHLRIGMLSEQHNPTQGQEISKKAIYRFLRDTESVQVEMLPLSLADHAAVVGPLMATARQLRGWQRHLEVTDRFARAIFGEDDERLVGRPRLLDGRILMQELDLKPGPDIGRLLREIEEAQAEGAIRTQAEALQLARQIL